MSPLKCCLAKSAAQISTQLTERKFERRSCNPALVNESTKSVQQDLYSQHDAIGEINVDSKAEYTA